MVSQLPDLDIAWLPFPPNKSNRSRIRLSKGILDLLGWSGQQQQFDCIGVFRTSGEFLVAPNWLDSDEGSHPFEVLFEFEKPPNPNEIMQLKDVPPAAVVVSRYRIVRFTADWTKGEKQLDLKVGSQVTTKLGWGEESGTPIYTVPWGPILCLISQNELQQANAKDFTGGHLRLS